MENEFLNDSNFIDESDLNLNITPEPADDSSQKTKKESSSSDFDDDDLFISNFELNPKPEPESSKLNNIIRIIGVGGGGSNAVTNMYNEKISKVDFIICNTDAQALNDSPVPIKINIGEKLTKGLGAGNDPSYGKNAALESIEKIRQVLEGAEMIFLTAGMGGGTGTGASPVIAAEAKKMKILTIAIITLPFQFEGSQRMKQAIDGIQELKQNVDALILIENDKIKDVFSADTINRAFKRADQVLTNAAKSVADIINRTYKINVDFADVKRVLTNSGIALMGTGRAKGKNRAVEALKKAIDQPLLKDFSIEGATKILFTVSYSPDENNQITMNELKNIIDYLEKIIPNRFDVIWGHGPDQKIQDDTVEVTFIAAGFETDIDQYLKNLRENITMQNKKANEKKDQEDFNILSLLKNISDVEKKEIIQNIPDLSIDLDQIDENKLLNPAYKLAGFSISYDTKDKETMVSISKRKS